MNFLPERIGGWWDRDAEIDVLAISYVEQAALVGECKWSVNPLGTSVLENLKQKAVLLSREAGVRPERLQYALFARSGFTVALTEQCQREGIGLYSVDQLVAGQ